MRVGAQSEKAAMAKARDDQRAISAKLQAQVNQMKLDVERTSKDAALSDGQAKEMASKERALLQVRARARPCAAQLPAALPCLLMGCARGVWARQACYGRCCSLL